MTPEAAERRRTYQREFARRFRAIPENRIRIREQARLRRQANPEKYRAIERGRAEHNRRRSRAWRKNNPVPQALQNHRSNARKRGLENALQDAHVTDLVTDNCFYCGAAPNPVNGVDRVNSSRGYVEDNVVTSCLRCNQAKSNMPLSEFVAWIERVGSRLPVWREVAA